MKTYKQKITFYKNVEINAKNAEEANEKLADLIHNIAWESDVELDDSCEWEDEPVACPECNGTGDLAPADVDNIIICSKCKGLGEVADPDVEP